MLEKLRCLVAALPRSPIFMVLGIFILCAAIVLVGVLQHDSGMAIVSLMTLAGLVMTFIDRHAKQAETRGLIADNTERTNKAASEAHAAKVETKRVAAELASKTDKTVQKTESAIAEVHDLAKKLNGRMEQLIQSERDKAYLEGLEAGRREAEKK